MVPAVDEPAVAGHAVDGEGPVVAVDGHGDEPVGHDHRPVATGGGLLHGDGMGGHDRLERLVAEARDVGHPGQDPTHGGLVDLDAHHGVGPGAEAACRGPA